MTTKDLIAGYAAYTDAAELGTARDTAPAAASVAIPLPSPFSTYVCQNPTISI